MVGAGCGLLYCGQAAYQVLVGGEGLPGDGEVLHGTEGVDAPVGIRGYITVAQEVVFGTEGDRLIDGGHSCPWFSY
ncbi:hypothetical protein D3C84_1245330 [compost metagenome]